MRCRSYSPPRPTRSEMIAIGLARQAADAAKWAGAKEWRLPPAEAYCVAPLVLLVLLAPRA